MNDRYIDGIFRSVLVELDGGCGPEILVSVPDEVEGIDAFLTDLIPRATSWTEAFNLTGQLHVFEEEVGNEQT